MPIAGCGAGGGGCDDPIGVDARDDLGAVTCSVRQEGGCHVLLVPSGAAKAAVTAVLTQAVPATNSHISQPDPTLQ